MSDKKIKVRTLLKYTREQLTQLLTGKFILIFDDNTEIHTNAKQALYSRDYLEIFNKYPDAKILQQHYVQHYIKDKYLNTKTHFSICNAIIWSIFDVYQTIVDVQTLVDDLAKCTQQNGSNSYNACINLGEYVTSTDITHFVEVANQQEIKDILQALQPTNVSIAHTYNELSKLCKNRNFLPNNQLLNALRAGVIKEGQFLQCIGPIGFRTDIGSQIFDKKPITTSFLAGVTSIYDSLIESRSAAKALSFTKEPLQQTEYFSRRLQLLSMAVERLHYGDCRSQEYITWYVKPPVKSHDGITTYVGDLKTLQGKYYLDEKTNSLKPIKVNDVDLYGKYIRFRSPIAGCLNPDKNGICSVCYGELSLTIPQNTNIGHYNAATLNERLAQLVLSVKHLDGSSSIDAVVLSDYIKQFMTIGDDQCKYFINKPKDDSTYILLISADEAKGLPDINTIKKIEDLPEARVSELTEIGLIASDNPTVNPITLRVNNRLASLTLPMLRYIREHGWEQYDQNTYKIDLSKWDYSEPAFILPQRHYNMADHSAKISEIIESSVRALTERNTPDSPAKTLSELHHIVNSRLDVNIAVLEIILYAAMIVEQGSNYNLPKANTTRTLGVADDIIVSKSLGVAMAYEGHEDTISNPNSFFKQGKTDHPMDVCIRPQETVDARRQ